MFPGRAREGVGEGRDADAAKSRREATRCDRIYTNNVYQMFDTVSLNLASLSFVCSKTLFVKQIWSKLPFPVKLLNITNLPAFTLKQFGTVGLRSMELDQWLISIGAIEISDVQ